jgi:hypothetical protein
MTKIKNLIATLTTRNPEAQVFMMTTRKQPFENYVAGVVGREEMLDQQWREEPGIASDDVSWSSAGAFVRAASAPGSSPSTERSRGSSPWSRVRRATTPS